MSQGATSKRAASPLTLASGFDFGLAARHCDGASVKLYTMHWPMIVNFWARELLAANAGLTEKTVVEWLVKLMDIPPDAAGDGCGGLLSSTASE